VAGNKIIVVERMNECSIDAGKRAIIQRFPSDIVGDEN